MTTFIHIRGARMHNLKNLDCAIQHDKLTVITGPSGSGKSSLAFDTLYAEGKRRYIESMSAYARQFLERIEKPDVDSIDHILPAIALEQKNSVKNARSTVGTATEIDDYLRLLFATIGQTRCIQCGGQVSRMDSRHVEHRLQQFADGAKLYLLAAIPQAHMSVDDLKKAGFTRLWLNSQVVDLASDSPESLIDLLSQASNPESVYTVVLDRHIHREGKPLPNRLKSSIEQALAMGQGRVGVLDITRPDELPPIHWFCTDFSCVDCGTTYPEPTSQLFSFNNPQGACPTCEGYGRIIGLDFDKVIPNKKLSLEDGAIHPYTMPSNEVMQIELLREAKRRKIRTSVPYEELTDAEKHFVMDGGGQYEGVRPFFDWLETKKYKVHIRVMLAKYRGYYDCPDCHGSRLRPEALQVTIRGRSIADWSSMPLSELEPMLDNLELTDREIMMTERLMREITRRVRYLNEVGLSYLTLARQSRTLSGGESQRINLSSALGSALTDTLYVLDEPTVGLHARDTQRLLTILHNLRDHGNTVVVVEHDPEMMRGADHIIDIGPSGGRDGGYIVFEGPFETMLSDPKSATGRWLSQPHRLPPEGQNGRNGHQKKLSGITITGARGNNLKNITVTIPTEKLVCITGVSGSGKSTLIKQTLYAGYHRDQGEALNLDMAPFTAIEGLDDFEDVVLVDQSPPGRSARSNPVTYIKAYDDIRTLFANTRRAKTLGITSSDFSFNSVGGRCETCEGLGTVTIDMQFMADVTMTCNDCKGKRFSPLVLSVDYNDKTIDDVLNMTIDEAAVFFKDVTRITNKLRVLQDLGLGYLGMGQSTSTLSGGEAQRLKLASYLKSSSRSVSKPYLFLFDEPTTGLHLGDIHRLVEVFRHLVSQGHSLIVIEHNTDFIVQCDYLIDLGPEGGDGGGYIVAQGGLQAIMDEPTSFTGQALREYFNQPRLSRNQPELEPAAPAKKAAKKVKATK